MAQNKDSKIFVVIGLRTIGDCIETDFGHKKFQFDFNSFLKFSMEKVLLTILSHKNLFLENYSIKKYKGNLFIAI
jgi:hypothetical protein